MKNSLLEMGILSGEAIDSFHPFIVDPFQKGTSMQEGKQEVTNIVSFVKNGTKYSQTSMDRTSLGSQKIVWDMGSSSHWR